MAIDGTIKFDIYWEKKEPLAFKDLVGLNAWRNKLHDAGLIGANKIGEGFGNISARIKGTDQFIITGNGTGRFPYLCAQHYSKITGFDIDKNYVKCEGLTKASSESLSHAVIYHSDKNVNAVVHVHNKSIWEFLIESDMPKTSMNADYGTPFMAKEIERILKTGTKENRIIAMGGHLDGIITFGKDLEEAVKNLFYYF